MKILFDQGTRVPLRPHLVGHDVSTVFEMGWAELSNGDLLRIAEGVFELFVTTDQKLEHQQNLTSRTMAILVLPTTSWLRIQRHAAKVIEAISAIRPGELVVVALSD